jgi:hypothetical protein
MSDASQDVPEAPMGERLADLIENMLNEWPTDRPSAKVTMDMTFDQWGELLETLRRGAYEVSDQG